MFKKEKKTEESNIDLPENLPENIQQPQEDTLDTPQEEPQKINIDQILLNHEQRIQSLEAAFLRIRGAI